MSFESYPPPFRPLNQPPPEIVDSADSKTDDSDDPIPVLDFQCLGRDKHNFEEACKEWGAFRLVNHGIPENFLAQLQDCLEKIFSLPFETKQGLFTTPLSYFWGTPVLTTSGTAISRGPQNINRVEGLNILVGQLPQIQPQEDHILSSFRVLFEEYGKHMFRVASSLYQTMAENLNLETVESKFYVSESTGFLRLYRYPPYPDTDASCGMEAHTDSATLAILNENHVGGLQVFKNDQWFTLKPIPNTLIVNLGDMIKGISDDQYHSVLHKVKVNRYRERISICYFVFPEEESVIRSSKYRPFTYSDFRAQVQQDVKTIGRKVGLERFKIVDSANGF